MTDRMEKLALIPFSLSCNSDLSVAVGTTQLPEKKYADQTTDTSLVVTGMLSLSISLSIHIIILLILERKCSYRE